MKEPDPTIPPTEEGDTGSEKSLPSKPFRTPIIVWSVFIVSCGIVIVCAILSYIFGFDKLISMTGDIFDSLTVRSTSS